MYAMLQLWGWYIHLCYTSPMRLVHTSILYLTYEAGTYMYAIPHLWGWYIHVCYTSAMRLVHTSIHYILRCQCIDSLKSIHIYPCLTISSSWKNLLAYINYRHFLYYLLEMIQSKKNSSSSTTQQTNTRSSYICLIGRSDCFLGGEGCNFFTWKKKASFYLYYWPTINIGPKLLDLSYRSK
jgi:hypothetical protein